MAIGNSRPVRRWSDGYTLLELLIVMLIIGLVAGLATTVMSSQASPRQLAADTRKLVALTEAARDRARLSGQTVRLTLEEETHSILSDAGSVVRLSPGVAVQIMPLIDEALDDHSLRFFPDGSSSGGTIELRAGERVATVTVDWLTGHADGP